MPEITDTFLEVLVNPESLDSNMKMIERFIIILYDRTSSEDEVNAARKVMFANKGRELDKIPPTRDALVQHSRRAILQASFVWHDMLKPQLSLPSPADWGWEKLQGGAVGWCPKWMLLPSVVHAISDL